MGLVLVIPTGLETAVVKALEKSLTAAFSQVGKRLWKDRFSPAARREKESGNIVKQLAGQDLAGKLRLTVVLPDLSTGVSLAQVKASLGGPVFQGLLHELIAARVMNAPEHVVERVRENMQLATRLEFPKADGVRIEAFGGVLFAELDRVVVDLVAKLDTNHEKGLNEFRQESALALLNANADGIKRHNAYLKRAESLTDAAAAVDWESAYRLQAATAHGFIEPPDFERKRKVPIDALFVSPQVDSRDDAESVEDVWGLSAAVDRTVLLGDPGGGKSTASNVLTWRAANDPGGLIPFVVVLRNFVDDSQSILDHIESRLSAHYQCPAPPAVVEGLLLSGRALVIFDGLDELIDTSRRRDMTNRVELFCARYPLVKVMVTSRRVGYDEAAMDPKVFDVYELAEFSDDDVATYVTNWFIQVDGTGVDRAHALAESFIRESATVRDLRKNPLMLALMCIIYRGQNWIPRNRPEMYEHCAELLFEKWDSTRQIYVDLKAGAHVDGAIKQLAYWMFTEPEMSQGVTEGALIREATAFLEPGFTSQVEARQAARQFVEFCRGRGWVLTDVGSTAEGETLFAFMHRTFMEYFAAYELTRRHDGPEAVGKAILPHVAAAEWEMVAELAVQISNKHSRDGAARLLSTLLKDRRYRSAVSRRNVASFALRCLGFVHVPVPLAREIGRAFVGTVIRFAVEGHVVRSEHFPIVSELREAVETEVAFALGEAVQADDVEERKAAVELLLSLPALMTAESPAGPLEGDFARWSAHQETVFAGCGDEILAEGDINHWITAWRHRLISLERLVTEGPLAEHDPLKVLFKTTNVSYFGSAWVDWGSFIPFRLLQADFANDDYPVISADLEWLGEFIDRLGAPPWVSSGSAATRAGANYGAFLADELPTDRGWTLFRLLLMSIEQAGVDAFDLPVDPEARQYTTVLTALAHSRRTGRAVPEWLADAIGRMPEDRHDLVSAWLRGEVGLVRGGEPDPT